MRVVFMGTPEIAAVCLQKILDDGFEVVGAFSQPDRPQGRKMKILPTPVKEVALAAGIPVFQPESFRTDEAVAQLAALQPDVCAVVAYGQLLPQRALDVPRLGCVNIHASLLPQYRGSAPYQWAVLDGLEQTGVTAQYMALKMDAGDIIDTAVTPIGENETAGELLDRLAVLGAELLSRTLRSIALGKARRTAQEESMASFAPMLNRSMCPIDWSRTAQQVHNHIRGLHPWPVATAELGGTRFKIHAAVVAQGSGTPGQILGLTKTGLLVACGEGAVEIRSLQAEGGKRMAAVDYFRGHPLRS